MQIILILQNEIMILIAVGLMFQTKVYVHSNKIYIQVSTELYGTHLHNRVIHTYVHIIIIIIYFS
jgi:hypothetical protein